MSKSSPSTVTTVNPIAQAQLPFLQGEWQQGQNLAGLNGGTPAGQQYLSMLQDTAQANANNFLAGPGYNLMPMAGNALQGMLQGNYGGYAASPQAGYLSSLAPYAAQSVGGFANAAANAAYGLPTTAAPSVDALNSVGMTAMGMMPAGYQAYNTLAGMGQQALSGLTGLGMQGIGALTGAGQGALNTLGGLGNQAISALTGLAPQAMAAGMPAQAGLAGTAASALGGNPAFQSALGGLASGAYIDPRMNPALPGVYQSATQPLVNQYMTATAPGISGAAEAAGRYGSGALQNQQSMAEYNLGQGLATATSGIANNAYNQGLQTTLGAGSSLGNIYNTGIGNQANAFQGMGALAQAGVQNAGQLINQGYGTGGNLAQAGTGQNINALQGAYGTGGGLVQGGYSTGGQLTGAGANALQGIGQTALANANTGYGSAGNLNVGALQGAMQGLTGAGTLANQGYGTAGTMAGQAGQLNNSGQLTLGSLVQNTPDIANYPLGAMSAAFNAGWAPLQNYSAILGGPQGGSSSVTSPNQQNILQSLGSGLGGIASFANLFGSAGPLAGIFSDRRLKTDIRRVGRFLNGLPLYTFRLFGRVTLGAMADDVERFRPEAVTVGPGGYLTVNYALALR